MYQIFCSRKSSFSILILGQDFVICTLARNIKLIIIYKINKNTLHYTRSKRESIYDLTLLFPSIIRLEQLQNIRLSNVFLGEVCLENLFPASEN